jgi:ATP-dependent Lon protease
MDFNDIMNNKRKGVLVFESEHFIDQLKLMAVDKLRNFFSDYKGADYINHLNNFKKQLNTMKITFEKFNSKNKGIKKISFDIINIEVQICIETITKYNNEYSKNKKLTFEKFLLKEETELKNNKNTPSYEINKRRKINTKDYDNEETNKDNNDVELADDEIVDDNDDDDIVDDDDDIDDDDDNDDDDNRRKLERILNKRGLNTQQNKDFMNEIVKTSVSDTNTILFDYYSSLSKRDKDKNLKMLKEINSYYSNDKPLLFKILTLDIPLSQKNHILKKYLNLVATRGESNKLKNWIDAVMTIPFGIFKGIDMKSYNSSQIKTFLETLQKTMDNAVWGHNEAKRHIIQIMGQKFRNPISKGSMIGIHGPPGNGKCFALDTPILMYDGAIKKVQDINIGDIVMGDDSSPRNVLSLGSGVDEMYEIKSDNGDSFTVNSEHILCLKMSGLNSIKSKNDKFNVEYFNKIQLKYNYKLFETFNDALEYYNHLTNNDDGILEIVVKDYLQLPKYIQKKLLGYKVKVNFNAKYINFDPYIIGLWLGNNNSIIEQITIRDSKVLSYLKTELPKYNLFLQYKSNYDYTIVCNTENNTICNMQNNDFINILRQYNLLNNKHIPSDFLINDRNNRLKLLAGLIDSNGFYNETLNNYEISQKTQQLSDDIVYLARSLGFATYQYTINKSCFYNDDNYYRIQIYGNNLSEIPILCFNNKNIIQEKDILLNNIQVISKGKGNYYGFTLDGNNRFLLGDFTVTHNTSLIKEGIAKAMNKPFIFISLGGATDASFLEGHSYTYEGSIYGRIATGLITSKCMDPIIYFDELDKISQTPKGEEITNLLIHLTDPVQNCHFRDKYFHGIELDLSRATMIFSFNNPALVDKVLLDRITTVETKYLLTNQKIHIGKNYLLPDILKETGLNNKDIIIDDKILKYIIEKYTYEGGVRKLKSQLYSIIRELNISNLTKTKINNKNINFPYHVTEENIKTLFKNKNEFEFDKINKISKVGIVNGLYATTTGIGGVLPIEIVWIPVTNPLEIKATGCLEKVIKESTQVACSLAWNLLNKDIQNDFIKKWKDSPQGFHLHCPDGSTPKDGPSAGAAITLALYSMFTNKKIKHDVALTGEINLQGNVTAIGGLEEKMEGAKKAGVKLVLYPKENQKDVDKIYERNKDLVNNDFKILSVETIHDVIQYAIITN